MSRVSSSLISQWHYLRYVVSAGYVYIHRGGGGGGYIYIHRGGGGGRGMSTSIGGGGATSIGGVGVYLYP